MLDTVLLIKSRHFGLARTLQSIHEGIEIGDRLTQSKSTH
jgi:hypothetical protein